MNTHIQSIDGEIDRHDALGLAHLVRTRQVSASELLEAVIDRAERLNPQLNFIATRIYDQARAVAAKPRFTGIFAGVPLAVKELGAMVSGVATTCGSRMMAGAVAPFDNEFVIRLRAQGFNLFCTTTAPEMGAQFRHRVCVAWRDAQSLESQIDSGRVERRVGRPGGVRCRADRARE
ncbi:Asp-tRNA(Asn)/Glu-tRNA(Gln) amidotransferase A subunit family amidase [Bradyrhizobium elkanii]|uniref:amidase family protein n=1 Tax=Bradyrhizobium elkanii TaxID=29448 RepID=UPI00351615A9